MKTVQTRLFATWLGDLKNAVAVRAIRIRIARVEAGLMGDVKSVGGGVSELRIDTGPGYRVYFTRRGEELVILLCGGDKSGQRADIVRAKAMAAEIGSAESGTWT